MFTGAAYSQQNKHPRTLEVEKFLTKETLDFLKSRFPDQSFMATVSIDAIHRGSGNSKNEGEKLPYLEIDGEEIVDEWDDPSLSNFALLSRVNKVAVVLSLSDKLTEDEISEIKSALYTNLNLLNARDSIEIRKRNFEKPQKSFLEDNFLAFLGLSSVLWAMLILGFGGLFWFLSARIKSGLKTIKIQTVNSGNTSNPVHSAAPADISGDRYNKSAQISGDLKFIDPFKTKEIIATYIEKIKSTSLFPNLDQMVAFDEFCRNNPGECGALLFELPPENLTALFAYSAGNHWLEALNDPKEISSASIELLKKVARLQTSENSELVGLLIQLWRLDKETELVPFIKSLPQSEAFTLINKLPAHLSLAVAREAYPGAWGSLLNNSFTSVEFSKERISYLDEQLKKVKPLRSLSYISKFKHDQDLIKYLLIADPQAEKEIYEAHENSEQLINLRKPFYQVLEAPEEIKKDFVNKVNIEDWAYSFFNLPRTERRSFEQYFTDKLKFRFFEILKQLDLNNPPHETVGRVREKVANHYYKYTEHLKKAKEQEANHRSAQPQSEQADSQENDDESLKVA